MSEIYILWMTKTKTPQNKFSSFKSWLNDLSETLFKLIWENVQTLELHGSRVWYVVSGSCICFWYPILVSGFSIWFYYLEYGSSIWYLILVRVSGSVIWFYIWIWIWPNQIITNITYKFCNEKNIFKYFNRFLENIKVYKTWISFYIIQFYNQKY